MSGKMQTVTYYNTTSSLRWCQRTKDQIERL